MGRLSIATLLPEFLFRNPSLSADLLLPRHSAGARRSHSSWPPGFSDPPGAGEWRFMDGGTMKCKIRVPARLWAYSLEALVRQRRGKAPAEHTHPPALVQLLFQPARLASPRTRMFADYLAGSWRAGDAFGVGTRGAGRAHQKNESIFLTWVARRRSGIPTVLISLF